MMGWVKWKKAWSYNRFKLMTNLIFNLTASALKKLSRITGFTYNEINIIIYYFIIPFTWCIMLDIIFDIHFMKLTFILVAIGFKIGCRDFKTISDWAFYESVRFLNYFNRFGSNYYKSSVWVCVSLPVLVYIVLVYFTIKH